MVLLSKSEMNFQRMIDKSHKEFESRPEGEHISYILLFHYRSINFLHCLSSSSQWHSSEQSDSENSDYGSPKPRKKPPSKKPGSSSLKKKSHKKQKSSSEASDSEDDGKR